MGVGAKPAFLFNGPEFETDETFKAFANLIIGTCTRSPCTCALVASAHGSIDFFRGTVVDHVNLRGDAPVIVCSIVEGKIHFQQYSRKLLKSGTEVRSLAVVVRAGLTLFRKHPRVELSEIGPEMVLSVRRTRLASPDLRKDALRQPPQLKQHKEKNKDTVRRSASSEPASLTALQDAFGQRLGKVHMQRQDLNTMATRRFKAFKKGKRDRDGEPGAASPEKRPKAGGDK